MTNPSKYGWSWSGKKRYFCNAPLKMFKYLLYLLSLNSKEKLSIYAEVKFCYWSSSHFTKLETNSAKHWHHCDEFWFLLMGLYVTYQDSSNEFTQVPVDVLFQLKGKHSYTWLFTMCESCSLPFSVPSRDMKSGGTAKILYGVCARK